MGFEVIVRPVVFPNIRPAPSRSLPPVDDATQGQARLSGGSGQVIALMHNFSSSASHSGGHETSRTFDVARVSQQDEAGNVNKSNFVDVEVAKKIDIEDAGGNTSTYRYTPVQESDNVEIIKRDQTRTS